MTQPLSHPLAILGFLGQALFFGRWIVQWWVSERLEESTVPLAFWVISLIGGAMLLLYAALRGDPVFVLGQTVGVLNYSRNIHLIRRRARSGEA